MARKLFALENDGAQVEEMEVADTEVGEVADVQTDVMEDAGDIDEGAEGVEAGVEAGEDLEKVEDLVEDSIENGDGLDPVAAEAIRIAVESICSRVGANPKAVYSLYATENFSSPSSRKRNSSIALEGVKDFLKDLWKKIKDTLTGIWTKVKAFWAKHVSTLGRVKKALESMKAKVSESSGKFDGKAYVDEAPSGLVSAFAGKNDINTKVIGDYIASHKGWIGDITTFINNANQVNSTPASTNMAGIIAEMNKLKQGNNQTAKLLIGGINYSVKFDTQTDAAEGGVTLEIEKETIDNAESKLGVSIAAKDGLKTILTDTLTVINETVKFKEKADKYNDAVNKQLTAISKAVEGYTGDGTSGAGATADAADKKDDNIKAMRLLMKQVYKINAKVPTILNDQVSYNIKLAKAVLSYCSFCLKNYK